MTNTVTFSDRNLIFKIEIKDLSKENIIKELWYGSQFCKLESSEEKFKNIINLSFVSLISFQRFKIYPISSNIYVKSNYSVPSKNSVPDPHEDWKKCVTEGNGLAADVFYNVRVKYNNEYKYYKFIKYDLYNLIAIYGLHVNFPQILKKNGFPLLESTYSYRKTKLKEETEYVDGEIIPFFSDIE